MTADRLPDVITREPFEPFVVILKHGERVTVRRPLRALITQERLFLGVDEDEKIGVALRLHRVAISDVTDVESLRD
jgi:hypothetical protein